MLNDLNCQSCDGTGTVEKIPVIAEWSEHGDREQEACAECGGVGSAAPSPDIDQMCGRIDGFSGGFRISAVCLRCGYVTADRFAVKLPTAITQKCPICFPVKGIDDGKQEA